MYISDLLSYISSNRNELDILVPLEDVLRAGVYVENSVTGINYFIIPPNTVDKE